MEEIIKELLAGEKNIQTRLNILREFLQGLILKILYERKYFPQLIFTGGTALRFVHGLRRFSEDLDFSAYKKVDFLKLTELLQADLNKYGYKINLKRKKTGGAVANVFVGFEQLMYNLGLSAHQDKLLSIKLECDFNPPQGGHTESPILNKHFLFGITVFDLPSLMAGKLHALLYRGFTKGRDYYDLLWYLTKKIKPNTLLLRQAIAQTQKVDIPDIEQKWQELLAKKLSTVDFTRARDDVLPFLEDPAEADLLTASGLLSLLSN